MLHHETFPVGALQCNCTILADEARHEAIVIDPGDEVTRIVQKLAARNLRVTAIVHTHAHIDHIGGTAALGSITGAQTYLHADDLFLHQMLPIQASLLGLPTPQSSPIDHRLVDDTTLPFGAYELAILHTPGHTPGSVCFAMPDAELCFSGDTLFSGGVGRTDLWGGDATALKHSIRHKLYALHGSVQVIAGHGPPTSIDQERRMNPFVRG